MKYLLWDTSPSPAGDTMVPILSTSTESARRPGRSPLRQDFNKPPEGFEFVNSSSVTRPKTARKPTRDLPKGIRAPRTSLTTEISASPRIPSPCPDGTARSLPPTPPPEVIDPIPWQDYEIPEELGIFRDGTPREIHRIIRETLDEHRAMRSSKLQAQAILVRTTIETTGTPRKQGESMAAECTANISACSSPSIDGPESRSSSSLSVESPATTPESEDGDITLKPPKLVYGQTPSALRPKRSQQSLSSDNSRPSSPDPIPQWRMAALESKLQESKDRTTQSQKLFKLVPTNRHKTPPPPSSFGAHDPDTYECAKCLDQIPLQLAVDGLSCQHRYCSTCFSRLVCTSLMSQATFPPKCCSHDIPRRVLQTHLPSKALEAYDERALEYAVAPEHRYYCVLEECGRWIDTRIARRANGALFCPHCGTAFCSACRGPQHPRSEACPQGSGFSATPEQAQLRGLQSCFKCQALVERNPKSRHTTCKCRAEFCFTCGSGWHTCHCTDVDQPQSDKTPACLSPRHTGGTPGGEGSIDAAMAAIKAAEQRLRRDHEAEEVRLRAEANKPVDVKSEQQLHIKAHFKHLRQVLDSLRLHQRQALECAHERDDRTIHEMEESRDALIASQEKEILAHAHDSLIAENKAKLKSLKCQHATALMETVARHRQDQDELLASPSAAEEATSRLSMMSTTPAAEMTDDLLKATILENLLPAQEAERAMLKSQQARELTKWRARGEQALRKADSEAKTKVLRMRLEEAERVELCARRLRRRVQAEWRWFEVLFEDRISILREDELRQLEECAPVQEPTSGRKMFPRISPSPLGIKNPNNLSPPGSRCRSRSHSLNSNASSSTGFTSTTEESTFKVEKLQNALGELQSQSKSRPHLTQQPLHRPCSRQDGREIRSQSSQAQIAQQRERDWDVRDVIGSPKEIEEPHPGRRVYYGPTNSWMEREERRAGELREKRTRGRTGTGTGTGMGVGMSMGLAVQ